MFNSGLIKKALVVLAMPVLASAAFNYWNPLDTSTIPKKLSATGLYSNIVAAKKVMIPTSYHFEVNSALWSDDAHKTRWVLLKNNTTIVYDEKNDYWGYPDDAVFIKQFAIDTLPGDSTSRVLWETRFLVNKKEVVDSTTMKKMDQWYGYSYKWNKAQNDADLVPAAGFDDTIRVWPNGKGAGKVSVMKKWRFPGRNQCDQCHRVSYADSIHGRSVLGFFTAQLNRPHPDVPTVNQLEYFFATAKILSGTKPANWNATTVPRWRGIEDSTASVDVRARSFIAANCSGCHGFRGIETGATFGVDLNYDFHTMEPKMEFRNRTVSWPFGLDTVPPFFYRKNDTGNNPKGLDSLPIDVSLVVPGYPEKSVILFRQRARNTRPAPDFDPERNQMPPLASFEVATKATALIEKWIKDMPGLPPKVGIRAFMHRNLLKGPAIQGRIVTIPMDLAGPGLVRVSLTGIDGRTVELTQTSRTTYALPSGLGKGVYIIRVGKQNFTRYLF